MPPDEKDEKARKPIQKNVPRDVLAIRAQYFKVLESKHAIGTAVSESDYQVAVMQRQVAAASRSRRVREGYGIDIWFDGKLRPVDQLQQPPDGDVDAEGNGRAK